MAEKIKVNIDLRGIMNKKFQCLIEDKHRYNVVYGGAGSSKSFSVAQKYFFLSYCKKGFKLLVVRKTARSNRESTFALFKDVISGFGKMNQFKINSTDLRITNLLTNQEIIFAGLDDVEKLKSIQGITDIWIEEASEIDEADFNQLDIRLRGGSVFKQITLTFNPIDVNHWLKKRFVDKKSKDVLLHHSTYKDNAFLDEEYIKLLESYKKSDPYYYSVYALGHWGVLGKTVFDANKISEQLQRLKGPLRTGYFDYHYDGKKISHIKWVDDEDGYIQIHEYPDKRVRYALGGDTAGEGEDYFTALVGSSKTGRTVAKLKKQFDADEYTRQIYCLGMYYNYALIGVEVNFDPSVVKDLTRLGYRNQYIREVQDTISEKYKKAYGFKTTAYTRPIILNRLIEIVKFNVEILLDRDLLEEMLTFVRNEKGRMEAKNGAHDDLVMGAGILYETLTQVPATPIEVVEKAKKKRRVDYDDEDEDIDNDDEDKFLKYEG